MASGFRIEMGELRRNLGAFDLKVHQGISAVVDYNAAAHTGTMKATAPWTDRTTAARNGLHSVTFHELQQWTVVFAHAVNYGIWLETRRDFNGRYAIIMATVIAAGEQIMRMLNGLFGKI